MRLCSLLLFVLVSFSAFAQPGNQVAPEVEPTVIHEEWYWPEGIYKKGKREGEWIFWGKYGQPVVKAEYRNGVLHGSYQYLNGNYIMEKGHHAEGRRQGVWYKKKDYNNFTLSEYLNDTLVKETHFMDSNTVLAEIHFKKGLMHGYKYWKYDNGKLQSEAYYKEGMLDGVWKSWSREGTLQEELGYKDGKRHGLTRYYHANGLVRVEQNYSEGRLHGQMKGWGTNGELLEVMYYEHGQPHGERIAYWRDGTIGERGTYEHGKRVGTYFIRNADNTVDSMIFGEPDMLTAQYKKYNNGRLWQSSRYNIDGNLHGKQEIWDYAGAKTYEGNYVNGKKDGNQTYWSGATKKIEIYVKGEFVETQVYEKGKFKGVVQEQQDSPFPNADVLVEGISEGTDNQSNILEIYNESNYTAPSFPGGEEALQNWVAGQFNYPKKSIVKSRFFLELTITEKGTVSNVTKVFPIGQVCITDYETKLRNMPVWAPATKDGKPVSGTAHILIRCY